MTILKSIGKIFRRRRSRHSFLGDLAAMTGFALSALMVLAVLTTLVGAAPLMRERTHPSDDDVTGCDRENSFQREETIR